MRWHAVAVTLVLAACTGTATDTAPRPAPLRTYTNPVLDRNFADPAVLRAPDGFYYAYATQGEVAGTMVNIQIARSRNLVSWNRIGDALPQKPQWARATQDFWAPDISYHDGRYYLYYSAKPDAALTDPSRGLCLAVATADRPQGPFTDSGQPLLCGEGFVNIDPFAFDDPATGKPLLYWGSGFQSIKVRELAADRTSFAVGSVATDLIPVIAQDDPDNYQRLIEGAWVIQRNGWFYLFYSGDNCCGPKAHYAVMVARSRDASGPFETLAAATGAANSVILKRGERWLAPGHNSVVTDGAGTDWLVYHAVDTGRSRDKPGDDVNSRRVMLIDRIVWADGWPRIAGDRPSQAAQPAPEADVSNRSPPLIAAGRVRG
jgi:arabinan endo-1,5-alpha-L-arabinosidase